MTTEVDPTYLTFQTKTPWQQAAGASFDYENRIWNHTIVFSI